MVYGDFAGTSKIYSVYLRYVWCLPDLLPGDKSKVSKSDDCRYVDLEVFAYMTNLTCM